MIRRILSIFLVLCMAMPAGIMPVKTAEAATTDRTDMAMDFNYEYSTPQEAMAENNKYKAMSGIDNIDACVKWKHITSYTPDSTKSGLRGALESTDPADKYIRMDTSYNGTYGYGDLETIEITSDKVLDLNGQTIQLNDIRNKVDTHDRWIDQYYQSSNDSHFRYSMFTITNGATLTIIDSSDSQKGEIYYNAYMINPYKHNLKRYTTRDLFAVPDGNLVIYGGTFRAGRSKLQSDDDTLAEIKAVIGEAVEFGTVVTEYATGIASADATLKDVEFNTKSMLEKAKQTASDETENPATAPSEQTLAATPKQDGSNSVEEKKENTPDAAAKDGEGRNQTVDEKQNDKNTTQDNKANAEGTAKDAGPNAKLQTAKNAVVNAATDKTKINSMVESGFKVIDAIKNLFSDNEKSVVTQSFLGTVVQVGNGGTFVSYGGTYKGYGMTPNTRNAVIETTKLGKVYIYDGNFNGLCGANIFNIVEACLTPQTKVQYVKGEDGEEKQETVKVGLDETNGLRVIEMENGNFVDTSNIKVRGGTFNCGYEMLMVGLHEDKTAGSGLHDGDNLTIFPGSKGTVNLGVESYDEDMIRDGRIQICDNYGDGALVLMDETKGENDKVYHYRLFCTSEDLRNKYYLTVYPNEAKSNSSYSFSLQNRYGTTDENSYDSKSKSWNNGEENERAAFSSNEMYFEYLINSRYSEKEYVIPYMTDTDPFAQNLDTSDVWYYNTPLDTDGDPIRSFTNYEGTVTYTYEELLQTISQTHSTVSEWKDVVNGIKNGKATNPHYSVSYRDYHQTLKWLTYKVYRVDPLTRDNISESSVYGVDEPLVKVVYGASNDALKCRLPLSQLPIQYKAGEMYRVVLTVDEYSYYGEQLKLTSKPVASCESSIVFLCYEESEMKTEGNIEVPDYTPLQWTGDLIPGNTAQIQLVNGKAGQVDYATRKIFDVYYQWYVENPNGEDQLIAGTDNIYKGDAAGLTTHSYLNFMKDTTHKYLNTVDPADPYAASYINGLPTDRLWTVNELHAYTDQDTSNAMLAKNPGVNLSLANNNSFATNTDSIYLPKELQGETIYCKAIAVNTLWQKNYDHVQVFYSHKVTLPATPRELKLELSGTTEEDLGYVTRNNPMNLAISQFHGFLENGEYVGRVDFCAESGSRVWSKECKNLKAYTLEELPSASFPNDFVVNDKYLPASTDYNLYAWLEIYDAEGNWLISFKTHSLQCNFEKEAYGFDVVKNFVYDLDDFYYVENEEAKDGIRVQVTPEDSSLNAALVEGVNFTTTDSNVVTLGYDGTAKFPGGTGMVTLNIQTPKGPADQKVLVPVSSIEVSGIDLPAIGSTLDTTGEVPAGAPYTVDRVYWTAGKDTTALSSGTKARAYTGYTAHVVLKEAAGQKFHFSPWVSSGGYTSIELPYKLTLGTNANSVIATGTAYGEGTVNGQDTVELTYTFDPLIDPNASDVADRIIVNFPESFTEGESISEYISRCEVKTPVGDAAEVTINPIYGRYSDESLKALGLSTTSTCDTILKGVQKGIQVRVRISEETGASWSAESVKAVLNGDDSYTATTETMYGSLVRVININNLFCEEGGKTILPAPVVHETGTVYMAVGDRVNLMDCLSFEEENVMVTFGSVSSFNLISEPGEIEALTGSDTGVSTNIQYTAVRQGPTGTVGVETKGSILVKVYNTKSQIPAQTSQTVKVTVKAPGGSVLGTVSHDNVSRYTVLSIPEHKGYFLTTPSTGTLKYSGLYLDTSSLPSSVEIGTVDANTAVNIYPGATDVYVDADELPLMNYSLDGVHWMQGNSLAGLEPETVYTLYYKQGSLGEVYSKQFRTAEMDYGIIIGNRPVTSADTGNLETDHWHYDADDDVLTLKNLDLDEHTHKIILGGSVLNYENYSYGLITSSNPLTIELKGENTLKTSDDYYPLIYSPKAVTITGTGSLKNSRSGRNYNALVKSDDEITVNLSGTLESGEGTVLLNGQSITYKNGLLKAGFAYYYNGQFINYVGKVFNTKNLDFSQAVHTVEVYNVGDDCSVSESQYTTYFKSDAKTEVRTVHSCNQKTAAEDYYASGSCDSGIWFYKSCSCGYFDTSSETFQGSATAHKYKKYDGKAADCITAGWKEYKTCTLCGYTTFEAIPALGHDFEVHEEKAATCTEAGWSAYKNCKRCGEMQNYFAYPALGHNMEHHAGKTATCTTDGWDSYDNCTRCDLTSFAKIKAEGHKFGSWAVTKEATEEEDGCEERRCSYCSETETKSIPATGHTIVELPEVAATCTTAGKTAGSYCSGCGAVIVEQTEIPATGHNWSGWVTTKDPTSTTEGEKERTCANCGEKETETIDIVHTHVLVSMPAKAATCTEDGYLAHFYCDCGKYYLDSRATTEVALETITIAATGHGTTTDVVTPATLTTDGSKSTVCAVCGEEVGTTEIIPHIGTVKLSTTTYTYSGGTKSPTISVKDSEGNTLVKGTDYTYTTPSGRKNVGKYSYKVTFKGNYSGTKTLYMTIIPKGTTISKVTAAKAGFTVTWKKQSTQTTGYQIRYSTSSKMTSAKLVTITKNTTVSKAVTKLKAKKKYYVQVRTYKTVSGTKYYSSWSTAKSVTTK